MCSSIQSAHLLDRVLANEFRRKAFVDFQRAIEPEEEVSPAEVVDIGDGPGGRAFEEQFRDVESGRNGTALTGGVNDGQRNHDRARPGRHLIDEVEREQNDFGWNRRRLLREDTTQTSLD